MVGLESKLQILFVGVDQHRHTLKVDLFKEGSQLFSALLETHVIGRVHDVDEAVGVLVVVLPVGADLALTADIPHVQLEAVLGLYTRQSGLASVRTPQLHDIQSTKI